MKGLSIRGKIAAIATFPFVFAMLIVFLVLAVVTWLIARILGILGILEALNYQARLVKRTLNRRNLIK